MVAGVAGVRGVGLSGADVDADRNGSGPSRRPGRNSRTGLRSVGGFGAATVLVMASALLGSSIGVASGLILMAALMPLALDLGRRLLVGFVWFAGVVGVASVVPGFPTDGEGVIILCLATVVVVVFLARREGWPGGLPGVQADAVLVVVGSLMVLAVLLAPVRAFEPELALLDASMAWDNLPHFQSMALLLTDGTRMPWYNYGFHFVGALIAGVHSPAGAKAQVLSVMHYEYLRLGLAWVCSVVLGFIAVETARALAHGDPQRARRGAIATSAAFLVSAPLVGFFGAFSLLGHGNFLWAVTAVAAASWLSLDRRITGILAGLLLVLGIVAAFSSYRSTQVGMAAAAAILAKAALDRRTVLPPLARGALSMAAGAVVFAGWVPFHYYEPSQTAAMGASHITDGASVAIPPITVLIDLAVLSLLGLLVIRRRPDAQDVLTRAMAPLSGLALFAVALAIQISRTETPLDSYYVWKSASALAIVAFPAILAFATAAFMPTRLGAGITWWLPWIVPVLAIVAVVVLAPHGGIPPSGSPAGLQILNARLPNLQGADAAGSGINRASQVVGSESVAAVVLPDESWGWPHRPESGSLWLNALRGVPTSTDRTSRRLPVHDSMVGRRLRPASLHGSGPILASRLFWWTSTTEFPLILICIPG